MTPDETKSFLDSLDWHRILLAYIGHVYRSEGTSFREDAYEGLQHIEAVCLNACIEAAVNHELSRQPRPYEISDYSDTIKAIEVMDTALTAKLRKDKA